MKIHTILAVALLLPLRVVSQDAAKHPAQAQCKFSDGTHVSVSYSRERRNYLFTTDRGLITIKGIRVPSGDYAVSIAKDEYSNWTLKMRNVVLKRRDSEVPALPMSIATKDLTSESFPIVFEQTGGSCRMYWKQNDYLLLSLEFTKENADIPVFKMMPQQKF